MQIQLDSSPGNSIRSYDARGIVINDRRFTHSVVVSAQQVERWSPRCFAELTATHLLTLAELAPAIIILGTGATQRFPPADWLVELQRRGIGVEVMGNHAAIRTYNVLRSEDRDVLLALLQDLPADPAP
jgi:uncharacterized protein